MLQRLMAALIVIAIAGVTPVAQAQAPQTPPDAANSAAGEPASGSEAGAPAESPAPPDSTAP